MSQNSANKLYELLTVRNFEDLQALDSATNRPAVNDQGRPDVGEADMFTFDWTSQSGKDYGTVVILLNEDSGMDVFFGDNMGKTMEQEDKQDWFEFLNQLKQFATKNFLEFNPRNLNKLRYSIAGQAAIREGLFESWQGNATTSWNGEPTQARLMVRHKKRIGEGDARYRYIESMFVETADGERYRLPFTRLSGGRAMVEHVRQGGKPYDLRGQHIVGMVEELNVLSRFRRANLGRVFEGNTQGLVTEANAYYENLNRVMQGLGKARGYQAYFENWNPEEITAQDMVIEDIKTLFVEQNLDSRIEAALPLLARIQQGNAMKEAQIFESWVDRMMEGTWSTPDTPEKQQTLVSLLSDELPVGADATNATELLYDLIGDDILFDRLHDLADDDANADARQTVIDRLVELQQVPDVATVLTTLNVDTGAQDMDMDQDQDEVDEGSIKDGVWSADPPAPGRPNVPPPSPDEGPTARTPAPKPAAPAPKAPVKKAELDSDDMAMAEAVSLSRMRNLAGLTEYGLSGRTQYIDTRTGKSGSTLDAALGKDKSSQPVATQPAKSEPAKAPAKTSSVDDGDAFAEDSAITRMTHGKTDTTGQALDEKLSIDPDAGPATQTITPAGGEVWSNRPAGTPATPPAPNTTMPSNLKPPAVPAPANPLPNVKPFGAAPLGADGKPMKEVPMDEAEDYSAYDDTLAQILKHAGVDDKVTPALDYETGVAENRSKWDTVGRPENFGLSPHEVILRFPHEVRQFMRTGQVDDDLYHALYDWYVQKGEMPYGIMKDRDGDSREWIAMQLGHECDLEETAQDYATEQELDEMLPAIPAIVAGAGALARAAVPVVVDIAGALARPAVSALVHTAGALDSAETEPESDSDVIVDESACNMTAEGEFCPEHGLEECGMYEGDYGLTLAPTAESREFDLDRLRLLALGK